MPTWIRVKDDVTGDEYDVDETSLRAGMTPIAGYPQNSGPGALARPGKPFVGKDGKPPTVADENLTAPLDPIEERGPNDGNAPAEPAETTKEQKP